MRKRNKRNRQTRTHRTATKPLPLPDFVQGPDGFVDLGPGELTVSRPQWVQKCYDDARKKVETAQQRRLDRLRINRLRRSISQDPVEIERRNITTALISVGVENIEGCLAFAFGPMFDQIPMSRWWECWNGFHKKEFQIFPNDDMHKTFQRIGKCYVAFMTKYFKGNQFPRPAVTKEQREAGLVEVVG